MPQHTPSPGPTSPLRKVLLVSQDTVLSPQANGAVVSNKGAAGAVAISLPAPAAGLSFTFVISVAQTLTLNSGAYNMLWGGGSFTTLANGSVGDGIELIADGDSWVAPFYSGAWD